MYFEALKEIEYCIYGELRRAIKGNEVFIPVRSVAKELLANGGIRPIEKQGYTLEEIANPKEEKPIVAAPTLREGSLVRIKDIEEIATVLEVLKKQVKVEFTSGQVKRVTKSRIEEVLD